MTEFCTARPVACAVPLAAWVSLRLFTAPAPEPLPETVDAWPLAVAAPEEAWPVPELKMSTTRRTTTSRGLWLSPEMVTVVLLFRVT